MVNAYPFHLINPTNLHKSDAVEEHRSGVTELVEGHVRGGGMNEQRQLQLVGARVKKESGQQAGEAGVAGVAWRAWRADGQMGQMEADGGRWGQMGGGEKTSRRMMEG